MLLLEKGPTLGGTCLYSGGNLLALDQDGGLAHLTTLAFNKTPTSVLAGYLEGLSETRSWLHALGATTRDVPELPRCWPNIPGADAASYYAVVGEDGAGPSLWRVLEESLSRLKVDVRTSCGVDALVNRDGRVQGVVTDQGEEITAPAVVLATGGYENDAELCDTYLPLTPLVQLGGSGFNTGDGLRLAASVGARLWHMSTFFGFWGLQTSDYARPFPLLTFAPSTFITDSDGRRFHAEIGREPHDLMRSVGDYLPSNPNHPHLPAYLVFDQAATEHRSFSPFPNANNHRWSDDNRAEIARWGWTAPTPELLAEMIGVPPEALASTFSEFNDAAASGQDAAFHRAPSTMAPLVGPLYALRIWPSVASTSGGPRRDEHGRVLGAGDVPIAGLYAAGGNGSVWGQYTDHGGGLTDGLVFGRRAARHAVTAS